MKPEYKQAPAAELAALAGGAVSSNEWQSVPSSERRPMSILSLSTTSKARLVDQAYQEFCDRCEAGENIDADAFCAAFPNLQSSLARVLQAHQFLEDNPELTNDDEIRWPLAGDAFLDYRLILQLGQGAFARVFLATESKLGNRLVAVKIAQQGGAAEADILGRFVHPNIVPVYSIQRDQPSGLTLVCMPYLGSATLHDVLDRLNAQENRPASAGVFLAAASDLAHPLDRPAFPATPARILQRGDYLDGVRWIGAHLADALSYIHERGVLHLDLKPSNVLLNPQGMPMLLDFNLSSDSLQDHRRLGGTLPYMSPEQLLEIAKREQPTNIGAGSDVFSLGVILYQLATGMHPFGPLPLKMPTNELAAKLLQRQEKGVVPVRQHNPDVDPTLAGVIERCLSFAAAGRPQAAAEIAATLRGELRPAAKAQRCLARHPKKSLASAFLLFALVFAGVAAIVSGPPANERHYQAGLDHLHNGQYAKAIMRFNSAVEADPEMSDAYFARGRTYQKLGINDPTKHSLAITDFDIAEKLTPTGRNQAAMGYSLQGMGQDGAALLLYQQAESAGFTSAGLYNNLGYCLYRTSPSKKEDIRKYLDEAIKRDPTLQAAFHNRAMLQADIASKPLSTLKWIKKVPDARNRFTDQEMKQIHDDLGDAMRTGEADFMTALKIGPRNSELLYNAAAFYARASEFGPHWTAPALEHLTDAVKNHGFDQKRLLVDEVLGVLPRESLEKLAKTPVVPVPLERSIRFVDPIQDAAR